MAIRILMADDALFTRVTLKRILTGAGYDVVGEAQNGVEVVQKYVELKPDLVTVSIAMPGMNGIQAFQEIRKIDPNAKVVISTAMDQKNMVIEAVLSGAKDFVVKPFQAERVLAAVRRLVA